MPARSIWPCARAPDCSTSATPAWWNLPERDALAALQAMTSNDAGRAPDGPESSIPRSRRATAPFSTTLLVYRLAASHFLLTVSAANLKKDVSWILDQVVRFGDVAVVDTSSRYAVVTLQGPASREVVQALTGADSSGSLEEFSVHLWGSRRRSGYNLEGFPAPGRTASTSWSLRSRPSGSGRRSCRRETTPASSRPAGDALGTLRLEAGQPAVRCRRRRDDDRAPGWPRVDCRLGQGRVQREGPRWRSRRPRGWRVASSASRCWTPPSPNGDARPTSAPR